jgi:hypothetical protein
MADFTTIDITALQRMHLIGANSIHVSIDWCIDPHPSRIAAWIPRQGRSDAIHRVFFALRHRESST